MIGDDDWLPVVNLLIGMSHKNPSCPCLNIGFCIIVALAQAPIFINNVSLYLINLNVPFYWIFYCQSSEFTIINQFFWHRVKINFVLSEKVQVSLVLIATYQAYQLLNQIKKFRQ